MTARPRGCARQLDGADGVLRPGGFGVRGIEGKIGAAGMQDAGIPVLGLCLGCSAWPSEVGR